MNNLDSMLERNREFAARQSAAGMLMPSLPRALPNVKAVIIGCADMRVDPAHVLGIKPGEAVVVRNIGGRIMEPSNQDSTRPRVAQAAPKSAARPCSRRVSVGGW